MINKISFAIDKSINLPLRKTKSEQNIQYNSNPYDKKDSFNLSYYIPFTGKKESSQQSKLDSIMFNIDSPAKKLITELKNDAKLTNCEQITPMHVIRRGLVELDKFIDELNEGKKDYGVDITVPIGILLTADTNDAMLSDPIARKRVQPVIKENISKLNSILNKGTNSQVKKDVTLSEELVDEIWSIRDNNEPITPYVIMDASLSSTDKETTDFVFSLENSIANALMKNDLPMKQRAPFSEYENKAENVLKNLSLGTNMFITYDNLKETPDSFLDTVIKTADKYKDKMTVTQLNPYTSASYFAHVVKSLEKDKSKQHIIIANPSAMTLNDELDEEADFDPSSIPSDVSKVLSTPHSNIKFLFYDTKDNYYSVLSSPKSALYGDFDEASIPALSTVQMIKMFKENPILMQDIKKPFSKNATEKVIEASVQLDGVFPNKTQNLMKKIVTYYIDKKEINDKDVTNYLKEASSLFKKDNDDSSFDVIFDTEKRLKDMVGKMSTQKEAAAIVKQIRSNKMGTKGIIIYSQDGSPGSGRRYTAKVIAGEARVPYVEINAVDFGTKDVDLFGGGAISPEAAVKKLFAVVKAQAEANSNRSAVLFVENFEYFSVGEMVSLYHQKAMAQLLREMDKAEKEGLNILVAGSVSDPKLIGEAAMKSFKFVDTVEVASPAFNKQEREQVIAHSFKDLKVKLSDSSEEQKDIISYSADITDGFPFIQLKNFVKKAQSVALERGHKLVTKSDITEAYLQLTTGRPAMNKISDHERYIVTSHECGHATNLEVMNNSARKLGKPWHVPGKVDFITLDPRGWYGGAVYHGEDMNREISFEYMFADIVCSFGGNSAENLFYGMDGSYGISADMEAARNSADCMVKVMGLGAKTGKMALTPYHEMVSASDKMKEAVEDDERVILNNAKMASDMITNVYADFNKWFTEKYAPLVGTGNCLVDGDEFRKIMAEWRNNQSPEKQKELDLCDEAIVKIMEATKKGIMVHKNS